MRLRTMLAAAALLAVGSSAEATTLTSCAGGCRVDGGLLFNVDYTVPADGRTYRWDLWTDSLDPAVTVGISAPNEVFTDGRVANGDGSFHTVLLPDPIYTFAGDVKPGHTSYVVGTQASFDTCGPSSPAGQLCEVSYNVWGNGIFLSVGGLTPGPRGLPSVRVFFAQTVVPEPQSWALAILGLGAAGAMLRRRRPFAWGAAGLPSIHGCRLHP